jgi:hypothetical protein
VRPCARRSGIAIGERQTRQSLDARSRYLQLAPILSLEIRVGSAEVTALSLIEAPGIKDESLSLVLGRESADDNDSGTDGIVGCLGA